MQPVRFDPAAEEELTAAAEWYDEQAGLGGDLLDEVSRAARRVAASPRIYALAPRVARRFQVRACPVERFPYSLFFMELADEVRILAVAHQHRRPGYWRQRLRH